MNRKLSLLFSLTALTLAVLACGGKGESGGDSKPAPSISSITTEYEGNKVVAGKSVTLIGSNFSAVAAENKVLYGIGLEAKAIAVSEAAEDHLIFTAPAIQGKQLGIRVSTNGKESNTVVLEYIEEPEPEKPWDPTPTVDFVKLGGTKKTIVDGVEWTTFNGKWEGQVRNINIVKTTLDQHNKLGIYFNYSKTGYPSDYPSCAAEQDPRDLDKKCIWLDAIAGTNGPMACCQFVRVNGEVMHAPTEQEPWIQNAAITIDGDVVNIVKVKDNYAAKKLTNSTVGCAGPLLVWEGDVQKATDEWLAADKDKWLTDTHPRTAIGLSKDGKTVFQVTVDGRWTKNADERAIGMSTDLLGKLMRALGCYKAMNFDGGGGTAMWVYGEGNARNIVNRVSENRTDYSGNTWIWDWNGTQLRPTGNAVYIKSDLKK